MDGRADDSTEDVVSEATVAVGAFGVGRALAVGSSFPVTAATVGGYPALACSLVLDDTDRRAVRGVPVPER